MKRLLLFLVLCLIPLQVFAISNLKLNGSANLTVSTLPANIVMTGDLAGNGNYAEFEIYMDINENGIIDPNDLLMDYFILTDGIGWIRNPEEPDEDIAGDESARDGKLKSTLTIEKGDLTAAGQFIVKAIEQNGSTATAILKFNIQPTPPYITGKITDKQTGSPLPNIVVFIENVDNNDLGTGSVTDSNGDYFANVEAGTYEISVWTQMQPAYKPGDPVTVTVGASETKTVNIQLDKYTSFVEGFVKKENGTAVPGIMVTATSPADENFYGIATTDNSGYYKLGTEPGIVWVGAPTIFQSVLASDEFVEPAVDTVNVAAGQTVQSNFTVKKYTAFVEGVCKVGDSPLAGVEISGIAFDIVAGTINFYSAQSQADGTYKMGVMPGIITLLSASKDGYSLVSPTIPYSNFNVPANQSVTGYNFTFEAAGGDKYIAGKVTFENGNPASNVYVVAINDEELAKPGYRIQYTDGSGNYKFENPIDGYWQLGVYKSGYHSTPYMIYETIYAGLTVDNADFILVEGGTGIAVNTVSPYTFALEQNYPNPFNIHRGITQTQIRFTLDQRKDVEIAVFNIQGQLVKRVFSGNMDQGQHEINWDGRDLIGNIVPSGTYFYRLQAGSQNLTKRLVIIR
ncbi:carboxypeptidase regulatory-like domain-containing protein [candidate division KSB1 bacterium]|nr:carboxypeptidase regulatory-like domain-containing protein [candidate division KSB1 bacterium]